MSKFKKTPSVWQRTFGKSTRRPANKLAALVVSKSSRERVNEREKKIAEELRQTSVIENTQKDRESHLNDLKASGRFYVCPLCQSVILPKEPVIIRHFKSHGQHVSKQQVAELLQQQPVQLAVQRDGPASGGSAR